MFIVLSPMPMEFNEDLFYAMFCYWPRFELKYLNLASFRFCII